MMCLQRAVAMACRLVATSTRKCTSALVTVATAPTARRTLMDRTANDVDISSTVEARRADASTVPATQSVSLLINVQDC